MDKDQRESTQQSLNKIAMGGGIAIIILIIGKALGYTYVLLATRLGVEQYGFLSLGFAVVAFLTAIASFGMESGILRYVSYYHGKNNKGKIKGVLYFALLVSVPLSLIIAIATFLFANQISFFFFNNQDFAPILKIFAWAIPFFVVGNFFLNFTRAFQKVEYDLGVREIIEKSVRISLTLLVLFFGYGILGASLAYLISTITLFAFSLYFLNKVFPLKNKIKPIYINKELLKYSVPLFFSLFLMMFFAKTDTLMIAYFKDALMVGLYNVASPTAALILIVPWALLFIFMPIITEHYARNEISKIQRLYVVVSKWVLMATIPIFLLIMFFSTQIIEIMFGQDFIPTSQALVILAFGNFVYSLSLASQYILSAIKKTKQIFFSTLFLAILNITLNYLLIPPYGINGGALATSISLSIGSFIMIMLVLKDIKSSPFSKKSIGILFAGIISFGIIYLINYYLFVPLGLTSILNIIIISIILCVSYVLLLFLFRLFEKEDIEVYRKIISKAKQTIHSALTIFHLI